MAAFALGRAMKHLLTPIPRYVLSSVTVWEHMSVQTFLQVG